MIDSYARWSSWSTDGFRIDTVKHVEHEFWQVFTKGVRAASGTGQDELLMFGEGVRRARRSARQLRARASSTRSSLRSTSPCSATFQFARREPAARHFGRSKTCGRGGRRTGRTRPRPAESASRPSKLPVNFLDNHDVQRFLFGAHDDDGGAVNALTLLMTEEGLPCLYYGTELDFFDGGNDPANRERCCGTAASTRAARPSSTKKNAEHAPCPAQRHGDTRVIFSTDHTGAEDDAASLQRWSGPAMALRWWCSTPTAATPRRSLQTSRTAGAVDRRPRPDADAVHGQARWPLAVTVPTQRAMIRADRGVRECRCAGWMQWSVVVLPLLASAQTVPPRSFFRQLPSSNGHGAVLVDATRGKRHALSRAAAWHRGAEARSLHRHGCGSATSRRTCPRAICCSTPTSGCASAPSTSGSTA